MADAFICDAIRTPIGRLNGRLSTIRADDLAAIPLSAVEELHRTGGRHALAFMCVGVGQGIALILERV